jgi:hypothetical protein
MKTVCYIILQRSLQSNAATNEFLSFWKWFREYPGEKGGNEQLRLSNRMPMPPATSAGVRGQSSSGGPYTRRRNPLLLLFPPPLPPPPWCLLCRL